MIEKMKLFRRKKSILPENTTEEINKDILLEVTEAIDYIQSKFINSEDMILEEKQSLQQYAMAGDKESRQTIKGKLIDIVNTYRIKVVGYTTEELVDICYSKKYGLDILQKYYENPKVDEIRVNNKDSIRVVIDGMPRKIEETLESEEAIENMIKRMIMDDVGISLDKSNPTIESVLRDGSRLTAVCHPVASSWNFILRKHDSFDLSLDSYIKSGTFDKYVWDRLSVLARGGTKQLFSGNVGAGKTTLMKKVIGELDDKLRIGVIGSDIEVNIQKYYSDRDVIELEEQAHLGVGMKELFNTMLRESIDVLVIEEFRGSGEAIEAVRACTRGLPNAFTTAHFNDPEEAIEGTAMFMLEEGLNLELELAKIRVARAFNIVVQLFSDAITGKKRLISITEVGINDNEIFFNELVRWTPKSDNYLGEGAWIQTNQPSDNMLKDILKRVDRGEVEDLGWDTSRITF